jgi:hypothetical protein
VFSSFDCSGTPFLDAPFDSSELLPLAFVVDPDIVYILNVTANSTQLTIGSVVLRDGECVTSGNGIGSAITGRPSLPPVDLWSYPGSVDCDELSGQAADWRFFS